MANHLRLGLNIDHVATVRNARGIAHPCPVRAALLAKSAGVDGITAHLREDRRHIRDEDIYRIKNEIDIPLNMEMAATDEMLKIALDLKPNACCIVPEKREEITTEGGLDVASNLVKLTTFTDKLKNAGIRVSLFIDPEERQIEAASKVGADIVELHTGCYCNAANDDKQFELDRVIQAAQYAEKYNIECHAGHGLCFETVLPIAKIRQIRELNIGHFLIGEAIFIGLKESIKKIKTEML